MAQHPALPGDDALPVPQPSTPSLVVDVDESLVAPKPSFPSLIVDVDESAAPSSVAPPPQAEDVLVSFASGQWDAGAVTARGDSALPSDVPGAPGKDAPSRGDDGPVAAPVGEDDDDEALSAVRSRRRKRPLLLALGFLSMLAVAGVWLLRPVPRRFARPCTLEVLPASAVLAPRDGVLLEPTFADGAPVKAGVVIGGLDDAAGRKRLEDIEARLAAIAKSRAALKPGDARKAKAALAKAEQARKALAAALDKVKRTENLPPAKRRVALAKAKKTVARAKAALHSAEAAAEAITHSAALEKLGKETEELQAEKARLLEAASTGRFIAPVDGRLAWLRKAGEAVKKGEEVARVEPGEWVLRVEPGLSLPTGAVAEAKVTVDGATLDVARLQVDERVVEGRVFAKGPLPGKGTLEFSVGTWRGYEALLGE